MTLDRNPYIFKCDISIHVFLSSASLEMSYLHLPFLSPAPDAWGVHILQLGRGTPEATTQGAVAGHGEARGVDDTRCKHTCVYDDDWLLMFIDVYW